MDHLPNFCSIFFWIDESTGLCPWDYESTGLYPMCLYTDIFLVLHTFDSNFLLIYEPIWQVHMGKSETMNCISITRELIT